MLPIIINPPWTAELISIQSIIACFPTNLGDPFAAVINISPLFAYGIFTSFSLIKTSLSYFLKISSLILDDLKTLILN